jgi:hypothetical protein
MKTVMRSLLVSTFMLGVMAGTALADPAPSTNLPDILKLLAVQDNHGPIVLSTQESNQIRGNKKDSPYYGKYYRNGYGYQGKYYDKYQRNGLSRWFRWA